MDSAVDPVEFVAASGKKISIINMKFTGITAKVVYREPNDWTV